MKKLNEYKAGRVGVVSDMRKMKDGDDEDYQLIPKITNGFDF